jgi:cytochrome c oxidase assembly protein subunit 15
MPPAKRLQPVGLWLLAGCLLIGMMVTIGGITRLTGSGLSITEWDLVAGIVPPLDQSDWEVLFAKYQATPQYRLLNPHFTLADFKSIFWWEYTHRLLGRLLGVAFLGPFLVFLARGYLGDPTLRRRVLVIFALGAFQGVLGWFMVASGLVDRPSVSHYRLAAHLLTAFLTMGFTLWVALHVLVGERPLAPVPAPVRRQVTWFAMLFGLQTFYGALVAGLKAGLGFNTFPLMGNSLVPPGLTALDPLLRNLTENPVTVQFVHRLLAWVLGAFGVWLWFTLRLHGVHRSAHLLLGTLALQFLLGAFAILRLPSSPVLWGTAHQAGAMLLLVATVVLLFRVRQTAPDQVTEMVSASAARP